VDHAGEAAAEEQLVLKRAKHRAFKQRRRAAAGSVLDSQLARLAPQLDRLCPPREGLCCSTDCSSGGAAKAGAPLAAGAGAAAAARASAPRMEWARVPFGLQPGSLEDGGLKDPARVERKAWQLESLFRVLQRVVACMEHGGRGRAGRPAAGGAPRLHVVDFGSGSGNSALALAALLPQCRFTLVDAKVRATRSRLSFQHTLTSAAWPNPLDAQPKCVSIGRERTALAGLGNVHWWQGDVADFAEAFDVGMGTHLCGGATDVAQVRAESTTCSGRTWPR
jgi:hypothetical protein